MLVDDVRHCPLHCWRRSWSRRAGGIPLPSVGPARKVSHNSSRAPGPGSVSTGTTTGVLTRMTPSMPSTAPRRTTARWFASSPGCRVTLSATCWPATTQDPTRSWRPAGYLTLPRPRRTWPASVPWSRCTVRQRERRSRTRRCHGRGGVARGWEGLTVLNPKDLYEVVPDVPELARPVLIEALDGFIDAGGAKRLATAALLAAAEAEPIVRFDADQLFDYRARRPAMLFAKDHWESYDEPRLAIQ